MTGEDEDGFPPHPPSKPDMVYIMNMEYGRMWLKEKDEWFSHIFQAEPKQQDLNNRRKKLRKEFLEAKRLAEINIRERKERRAKEAEAKAKAEAEAAEKAKRMKMKMERPALKKKEKKKSKPEEPAPDTETNEACPKGWKQVELTLQCECAGQQEQEKTIKDDNKAEESGQNLLSTQQGIQPVQEVKTLIPDVPCPENCKEYQLAEAVQRVTGETSDCEGKCESKNE